MGFAGSGKGMGEDLHCMGDTNDIEATNANGKHFVDATAASTALIGVQIRIASANNVIVMP